MKKLLLTVVLSIFLLGCSNTKNNDKITKTDFYFDTVVSITLYETKDMSLIDESFNICKKYEGLFSKTIATSEISLLNKNKRLEATDSDVIEIISKGIYYSEFTGGKFDITISKLSDLWDITGENPKVPDEDKINNALKSVNYKNISINDNLINLTNPDSNIDLGAIAKGYIADKIKEYLLSENVESGIIDLGGNVLLIGAKPDKEPFSIGIQKPFSKKNETITVLSASDVSIVSSGSYERYFYEEDKLYHHIFDTKTGYPVNNNLTSVTIISESSTDGDALSTSCFALGLKDGIDLLESLDNVEGIFIDKDENIVLTSRLYMKNNIIRIGE